MSGQILAVFAFPLVWITAKCVSYAKKSLWSMMNNNISNNSNDNHHGSSSSSKTTYANKLHCVYSYEMLIAELSGKQSEYDWTHLPHSHRKMPLFVTWYKRGNKNSWDLRGCLGTFSSELPIRDGIKKYAILRYV